MRPVKTLCHRVLGRSEHRCTYSYFAPKNIRTLLHAKHLSAWTFSCSYFLVLQAACFHDCLYFSGSLTNGARWFPTVQNPTLVFRQAAATVTRHVVRPFPPFATLYFPAYLLLPPPPTCSCGCTDNWRSNQRIYPIKFRRVRMAAEDGGVASVLLVAKRAVLQNSACACEYMMDV